jgi:cytochrome c556
MLRKFIRAGLFAALGVIAVTLAYGAAAAAGQDKKDKKKEDKTPSISEIMVQGHKGTDSFLTKLKGEVKDAKWEDALTHAKALNLFGEALGKNKPPKGEEKSWKELTGKYAENTKAVLTAVEKKDAKAATTALGAIGGSCGGCHKAHR